MADPGRAADRIDDVLIVGAGPFRRPGVRSDSDFRADLRDGAPDFG